MVTWPRCGEVDTAPVRYLVIGLIASEYLETEERATPDGRPLRALPESDLGGSFKEACGIEPQTAALCGRKGLSAGPAHRVGACGKDGSARRVSSAVARLRRP
jgi:hypothetical protein